MSGQCSCGQTLEFEAEELPQLTCPNCGRSLADQFKPKQPIPPQPTPSRKPEPTPTAEFKTQGTLDEIRQQSCYKTLRSLIEGVVTIPCVLLLLLMLAGIVTVVLSPSVQNIIGAVAMIVLGALGIAFFIAIKQALLLAIDGVDLLIADRTDRKAEAFARRQNALAQFNESVGK